LNWLNRLFRPDQPQQQTNEHDLHRAAAALLLEVARTDGTVAQEESQRLIKAVEKHWHLEPQEMDDILQHARDKAIWDDTTVLGIGERNGITSLGGLVARMYTYDRETTRRKYRLEQLRDVELLVSDMVGVDIPFNNPITGFSAFTHKAGIHAKAILNAPETYEALNPEDFGLTRYLSIAHKLTGWNAVKARAEQLGLELDDRQIKSLTRHIKALADERALTLDDVDELLHHWADAYEQALPQLAISP